MLPWWSMRGLDAVWRANGGQRPSKRPELRTQLTVSLWRSTPQLSFCPPLSLSLSNTHMHTHTLLRPRPHFHGPKIEASTWLTEKQKEASESRFSPKTNCLPLWRKKKKEARHHKEEVSPAILTLLPPPVLLQCNWVWSLSVRRSLSDPLKLRLTAGKVCFAICFFYTGHPAKLRK